MSTLIFSPALMNSGTCGSMAAPPQSAAASARKWANLKAVNADRAGTKAQAWRCVVSRAHQDCGAGLQRCWLCAACAETQRLIMLHAGEQRFS